MNNKQPEEFFIEEKNWIIIYRRVLNEDVLDFLAQRNNTTKYGLIHKN